MFLIMKIAVAYWSYIMVMILYSLTVIEILYSVPSPSLDKPTKEATNY